MFTDASIVRAIGLVREGVEGGWRCGEEEDKKKEEEEEEEEEEHARERERERGRWWVQDVIRLLDMAVIMAGAVGREEMVEEMVAAIEEYVGNKVEEEEQQEEEGGYGEGGNALPRRKKRRKNEKADNSNPSTRRVEEEGRFHDAKVEKKVPDIDFPIPRRARLSMQQFEKHLLSGQPLIITDALTRWPAFLERPWGSPSYLLEKTFGGRRLIPVEIGRSYTDAGWGQSIITFKEFMDRYMLRSDEEGEKEEEEEQGKNIAYLAQHDLFAQIPSLRNDISIPDYCYTNPPAPAPGTPLSNQSAPDKLEEPLLNAWFGPADTVSPLHTDPYHNILCQVVGKKYVRLYSPEETEKLYPRGVESGGVDMSNTSQVEVEGDEKARHRNFPKYQRATYMETVLEEGHCLYIPVGWWHYIRSLSSSFSVSFWWN